MNELTVCGLSYSYPASDTPVLSNISFSAKAGELTALIGPNGVGKTTLIKAILGLLKADGKISFDGHSTDISKIVESRDKISYLTQDSSAASTLTVFEMVLLGRMHSLSLKVHDEELQRVWDTLKALKLEQLASHPYYALSGGQRKIVNIAQAIVKEPSILILDEPTANLDMQNELEVMELIQAYTRARDIITLEQIKLRLPETRPVRALDIGTGAGFFAFLLCELGCVVTGIDYSSAMIENAVKNADKLQCKNIDFLRMDAQSLNFPDESFDFIFTRNVTWTLPKPARAYSEMMRVLAPGGRIMNCDANYGAAFREADRQGLTEKSAEELGESKYAHPARSLEMLRERNDIADKLSISDAVRPQWDAGILIGLGASRLELDLNFGDKICEAPNKAGQSIPDAERLWKAPARMFMVLAQKP